MQSITVGAHSFKKTYRIGYLDIYLATMVNLRKKNAVCFVWSEKFEKKYYFKYWKCDGVFLRRWFARYVNKLLIELRNIHYPMEQRILRFCGDFSSIYPISQRCQFFSVELCLILTMPAIFYKYSDAALTFIKSVRQGRA